MARLNKMPETDNTYPVNVGMAELVPAITSPYEVFGPLVPCHMAIVAHTGPQFTDYAVICQSHAWASKPYGTLEEAQQQHRCDISIERELALGNARALLREGFQPIEASHEG